MSESPPRDFPPFDCAVTRSVGAMCTWEGEFWHWDGRTWVHVERADAKEQRMTSGARPCGV